MRTALIAVPIALLLSTQGVYGQSVDEPQSASSAPETRTDEVWYAPCKTGLSTCQPWERDWQPHNGYEMFSADDESRERTYISKPPYKVIKGYPSIWVYADKSLKKYKEADITGLYLINCSDQSAKLIQQSFSYGRNAWSGDSGWNYYGPSTIAEAFIKKVCLNRVTQPKAPKKSKIPLRKN